MYVLVISGRLLAQSTIVSLRLQARSYQTDSCPKTELSTLMTTSPTAGNRLLPRLIKFYSETKYSHYQSPSSLEG